MELLPATFTREMMSLGILSYREQETLWQLARRCAATVGIPMAGSLSLLGTKMGTVTLPGVGTVSGAVAGALAGMAAGTTVCMGLNASVKSELRALARGR
jgi:hypothetical protein